MKEIKQKILIVDDMPMNISMLRNALHPDYKVYFALNGQDALDSVATDKPDLILLDIVMPGLDGFTVCEHLKSNEETLDIPIIFITAKSDAADETRGLALGAVDFITKPFTPPVVKARVQTHLRLIQTFAQLKDLEKLLRSTLDNAMDAIITTDSDGITLDFNPAAENLFGYTQEDVLGKNIASLIIPPETRTRHTQKMRHFVEHATETDTLKRRLEITGMKADGKKIAIEIALASSFRQGKCHFTAFLHDISERRLLMRSLNDTLKSAEAANQAKSEFLANMSHEIRTPMNAIIGLTKLAMQTELTPKLEDYLTKIDKSSHSMLSVINDVLDFSRIEAGKMRLTPVEFELHETFAHLSDMFAHQVKEKGIALRWSITADSTNLWGDAMRLEQVLTNLIGNAIKFTEQGEISVEATLQERKSLWLLWKFSVRDSGIGIDPERLPDLFEPFVQADGSITRKYGGTGLGLVICKRIIHMMGGEIWVEPHETQGSVFRFTAAMEPGSAPQKDALLPRQREEAKEEQVKKTLGGARILLVEDNPINMQVARELLERVGILVEEANHGGTALRMLQTGRYDAVLMDLQMPEVDGFTATRLIREDARFKRLPIIAMTAHAMEEDRQKCLAAGMNAHVSKPFDLGELYRTLAQWVHMAPQPDLPAPHHQDKNTLSTPFPNLPGLDSETGLARLAGDLPLYKKLLHRFYEDHAGDAETIAQALEAQDQARAERLAHTTKSVAGQLGAHTLQRAAASLEESIAQEAPQIDTRLQAFRTALEEIVDSLATLTVRSSAIVPAQPSKKEVDLAQATFLLNTLHTLLQEQDSRADSILEPLRDLVQGHAAETTLNTLTDCLKRYDHPCALTLASKMAKQLGVALAS